MLTLSLVVMLAQTGDVPQRPPRTDRVLRGGGRAGASLAPALFEFAPASGSGAGSVCACTLPTGSAGQTMTFTRASSAVCNPSGFALTGIANASLVECGNNLPRMETNSQGDTSLLVEPSGINLLFRFIDYANATWADVGTPTLTGSQVSPFTGTYANLAVQIDDNDAAAYEGRSQSVTVLAATAYWMHCYVKAGTLDRARITLDGTAATITGLSSTTWSIIEVGDASSSGVSISAQVMNGNATSDTGTVIWGGCQVEAGLGRTNIIPTVAAAATRVAEFPTFASPAFPVSTSFSWAASVNLSSRTVAAGHVFEARFSGADRVSLQTLSASGVSSAYRLEMNGVPVATSGTLAAVNTTTRISGFINAGVSSAVCVSGSCTSGSVATPTASVKTLSLGAFSAPTLELNGLISRVCIDTNPARCQ